MEQQMTISRRNSYVEVLEIIKYMDKIYIDKIPQKLIQFFGENKAKDYEFKYNSALELDKQNLNDNTLVLLAILNLNYWCEDEEHKKELIAKYNENEEKYQNELREKYNPDEIFKKKKEKMEENIQVEETSMVVVQEQKWYQKIFNSIREFFKRK